MRTLLRYCLLQIPGIALAALVLYALWSAGFVDRALALAVLAMWVLKDALLFPLYRRVLDKPRPPAGAQALVGERATARTEIGERGLVRIRGELWQACACDGETISPGTPVRVIAAHGLRLTVQRTQDDDDARDGCRNADTVPVANATGPREPEQSQGSGRSRPARPHPFR
jgi:membrane protein implicated in regulation of membrane protease activity